MNTYQLPLFPLNIVVSPGGLLPLKIFEARYLDMVRDCLRNKTPFGVVTVLPENERDKQAPFPFCQVGTSVTIIDADVATIGLMLIRCQGQQRFRVHDATQQEDGLVIGDIEDIPADIALPIPDDLRMVSTQLEKLIDSLPIQGIPHYEIPIIEPYQFDDCAWVANRWLELLDLPLIQKHRLMVLDSPLLRLELIQDILAENA